MVVAASCAPATRSAGGGLPALPASPGPDQAAALGITQRALDLHRRALVVDTHIDTTQRMLFEPGFDIGRRHPNGHADVPRMREGGLDAGFFSIWMPPTVTGPAAVRRALVLIDRVREAVRTHARDLTLATSVAEIERARADGKIAVLMGLEGGHMIDDDLGLLRTYAALGVRYLTLTHSRGTSWADSSGASPEHGGLTPFGRDVVRELNRLGVMVDVSHVSDETFADVLEVSVVPVIASHSSSRTLSDHPRNMTDAMLAAMAAKGGVVMINFHATFLSEAYRVAAQAPEIAALIREKNEACGDNEACALIAVDELNRGLMASGRLPLVPWEAIVDHIDHVVKVAGIDHVGIGSDFDGATMPIGMEDASRLPRLTDALLKRGYADEAVIKILGGNFLRVMRQVEAHGQAGR